MKRAAASAVPSGVKVPRWISQKTSLSSGTRAGRVLGAIAARSTISARPVDAFGLQERRGVGPLAPVGEAVEVALPRPHAGRGAGEVSVALAPQVHRRPAPDLHLQ